MDFPGIQPFHKSYRPYSGLSLGLLGLLWTAAAIGQGAAPESLGAPRLRAIAVQAEPPGPISDAYVQLLDTVADAIDHGTLDVAADRFIRILERQRETGRKGVPQGYVDYVLHRVAVERSAEAASAAERAVYFNAQENAVLEHLSVMEKQYSDRQGTRLPDFIVREPVLGEFGQDRDPVREGLPQSASIEDLPQRITIWRGTLDRVSQERTTALKAFGDAVRGDAELYRKMTDAEARLSGVMRESFSELE